MAQRISLEPFTKFLSESFKGKLNHYKSILNSSSGKEILYCPLLISGLADPKVQRVASRLIQSKQFNVPSLAELSTTEWHKFGGQKLVK